MLVKNRWLAGLISVVAVILACGCQSVSDDRSVTTAPAAESASSETLHLAGLAYGPFHAGEDPNRAIYPSAEEVAADIPTLAALTDTIRIYSSLGPASDIVRCAEQAHLSVDLGIWLGPDAGTNERELTAGIRLMASSAVATVTVGNEVLRRGDLPEAQLREAVERVRAAAAAEPHQVKVTTADTGATWLAHPDMASAVDLISVNLYPFWDKVPIDTAIQSLDTSYAEVKAAFAGKNVVIGETGWPSEGPSQGPAVANADNQLRYVREWLDWAGRRGTPVGYYYFEAFDESWKTNESGVGTHWGLYDEHGILKPGLSGALPAASPETLGQRSHVAPSPTGTRVTTPPPTTPTPRRSATPSSASPSPKPTGPPRIRFTSVPPMGSAAYLSGRVSNVDPKRYRVVVFIKVDGIWWVKPYWDSPLTDIATDGTWECDIVTGGHDPDATAIEAFVVRPSIRLPSQPMFWDVQPHAVAHVYTTRKS